LLSLLESFLMALISGFQLWQWRSRAKQRAIATGISPDEVDWILQALAGLDRLSLRLESFRTQSQIELNVSLDELEQLWQRRIEQHVPVQYLVGETPWRDFELKVASSVLIPRPETELLIDFAKTYASLELQAGHWVDLGTGSGAIAIGLALAFPTATIHAVDRSLEALVIAQTNAKNLNVQIHFYQGFWFEPLAHLKGQLSGMVSNPPYIPTQMVQELQPEVALHEPHLALDGGTDGLDCIRQLVKEAPNYLKSGGIWMIEMMAGQANAVTELLEAHGCYEHIRIERDLAGIERFAIAVRSEGLESGLSRTK
jgi:release factor glutamine methyltransferase